MFGPGIYTTVVSSSKCLLEDPLLYSNQCTSEADGYVKNHGLRSKMHAMLICQLL